MFDMLSRFQLQADNMQCFYSSRNKTTNNNILEQRPTEIGQKKKQKKNMIYFCSNYICVAYFWCCFVLFIQQLTTQQLELEHNNNKTMRIVLSWLTGGMGVVVGGCSWRGRDGRTGSWGMLFPRVHPLGLLRYPVQAVTEVLELEK